MQSGNLLSNAWKHATEGSAVLSAPAEFSIERMEAFPRIVYRMHGSLLFATERAALLQPA